MDVTSGRGMIAAEAISSLVILLKSAYLDDETKTLAVKATMKIAQRAGVGYLSQVLALTGHANA